MIQAKSLQRQNNSHYVNNIQLAKHSVCLRCLRKVDLEPVVFEKFLHATSLQWCYFSLGNAVQRSPAIPEQFSALGMQGWTQRERPTGCTEIMCLTVVTRTFTGTLYKGWPHRLSSVPTSHLFRALFTAYNATANLPL